MYGSKLIAYDPIRMKYDEVKYDYYEKEDNPTTEREDETTGATIVETDLSQAKDDSQRIFADFIATDIHPTERTQNKLISDVSDYLGSNDASIKLATTTKAHDAMFVSPPPPMAPTFETYATGIGVTSKTFKDNEAKPNQIETWLLQRKAQLQEFGNIIVTFTVAGNSSRKECSRSGVSVARFAGARSRSLLRVRRTPQWSRAGARYRQKQKASRARCRN